VITCSLRDRAGESGARKEPILVAAFKKKVGRTAPRFIATENRAASGGKPGIGGR